MICAYNGVMIKPRIRDSEKPITAKEWFLADLFNDPLFVEIRKDFWNKATSSDPVGISKLVGKSTDEEMTKQLIDHKKLLCETFLINEQTAEQGLFDSEYRRIWSRQRMPVAYIEGNGIVIHIGPETRPEDVMGIWKSRIKGLQDQLNPDRSKRNAAPKEPSLAFVIHKHVMAEEKIADIYRDYIFGKLSDYMGDININTVEDFRKYYNGIVKGFKNKD